jgi:hypothetical protein
MALALQSDEVRWRNETAEVRFGASIIDWLSCG